MRKYVVRMTNAYNWTTDEVPSEAPNNSVVLTIDDDGCRWISEMEVANLGLEELFTLTAFCKGLP